MARGPGQHDDDDPTPIKPLRPRHDSADLISWRLGRAHPPESCRWEHADGRWVSLTIAHEEEMGKVLLKDSKGRSAWTESYEEALALAKAWRA